MARIYQLRSGHWRAELRDSTGRRYGQTFPSRGLAQGWADGQERQAGRAAPVRLTVGEWVEQWQAARVVETRTAAEDQRRMRLHVLPMWKDFALSAVRPIEVQGWVRRLSLTLAPQTVRHCHALLSNVLTAAVRDGLLTENPCRHTMLPTIPPASERFLSRAEVDRLVGKAPDWAGALIVTLANEGLRWGEAAGLTVRQVDMLRRRLTVTQTLVEADDGALTIKRYPKGRLARTIPLAPEVIAALAAHLAASPPPKSDPWAGLIFRSPKGQPLRRSNFYRVWARVCADAKITPAPKVHDLRHTAASWLLQDGVPMADIQRFLGHKSITTTQRYSKLEPDNHSKIEDAWKARGVRQDDERPGEIGGQDRS